MKRVKIPLKLVDLNNGGFHFFVKIVVFGKKSWAVLDTGASQSVFNKSFIRSHTLNFTVAEGGVTTLFSTTDTINTTFPQIRVGKLKINNYPALGLDLDTTNETYQQLGHPAIVGIIGCDILYPHQAVIYCSKLYMTCKIGSDKKKNKRYKIDKLK